MLRYQCAQGICKGNARFFVHQETVPQRLATGDMETSPAGRSVLCCGRHLTHFVDELGNLPFRTNKPVTVSLQRI